MIKIVISPEERLNIPEEVINRYCELEGITLEIEVNLILEKIEVKTYFYTDCTGTREELNEVTIKRDDKNLVLAAEEYIEKHNIEEKFCSLKIVEIPDGVDWYIREEEMWGEQVEEKHRSWW